MFEFSKRHFIPPHNVIMSHEIDIYICIYIISIVGNTRWTQCSLLCCLFRFFRFASRCLFEVQFQHLSTVLQRCGSYQYRRWPWCLSIISWRGVFTQSKKIQRKTWNPQCWRAIFCAEQSNQISLNFPFAKIVPWPKRPRSSTPVSWAETGRSYMFTPTWELQFNCRVGERERFPIDSHIRLQLGCWQRFA